MNNTAPESENEHSSPRAAGTFIERIFNPGSDLHFGNSYLQTTKTLTYSYLFALPLVLLYEVGIFFVNNRSPFGIRIGADALLKHVLRFIGLDTTLYFAAFVLLAGVGVFFYERRRHLKIIPRYFAFMLGESTVYALTIGTMIALFVGQVFGMALTPSLQVPGQAATADNSLLTGLVLSLGAGVYEELIFRVFLVTLLYAALQLISLNDRTRYIIAAVIGGLIFSAVHYTGSLGDTFAFSSFTFRFLMGLALNGIFLVRGFGVAAMTHALYDVYVTLL